MLKIFVAAVVCAMLSCAAPAGSIDAGAVSPEARVVGYVFTRSGWDKVIDKIRWNRLTDINLAFIHPDAAGRFTDDPGLKQLVDAAHQHNVRVFISIGGGSPPEHLAMLVQTNPDGLASELIRFAKRYSVDGVDIDLENALINEHYPGFVHAVKREAMKQQVLVTAALASWNASAIPDSTLHTYDFINVMSYDKTGPWNKARPGQHSPFSMAADDFSYFNSRGVTPGKIIIGLPFYGYGFGPGAPESLNYGEIINRYKDASLTDSIQMTEGGWLYYNGAETIREKVNLARDKQAGGVMIWQVFGDAEGEHSLLDIIHRSLQEVKR